MFKGLGASLASFLGPCLFNAFKSLFFSIIDDDEEDDLDDEGSDLCGSC